MNSFDSLCQKILAFPDFYILEVETTGVDNRAQATRIFFLRTRESETDIAFDSLIRPTIPPSKEALVISGLSERMLRNASYWEKVEDSLKTSLSLEKVPIVSWTGDFDRKILRETARARGLEDPTKEWFLIDLRELYRSNFPELRTNFKGLMASLEIQGPETGDRALRTTYQLLAFIQKAARGLQERHSVIE